MLYINNQQHLHLHNANIEAETKWPPFKCIFLMKMYEIYR